MKNFKKCFPLSVLVLLSYGTIYAQSITINSPGAGQTWKKGQSHNVTWTTEGNMHAKVKIRLYNSAGTSKILNISNDTANNGSYTVPAGFFNAVANGNYRIRVKTLDNAVYMDSEVFKITQPSLEYEFKIYKPAYKDTYHLGGKLLIRWIKLPHIRAQYAYALKNNPVLKRSKLYPFKIKTFVKIEFQWVSCPYDPASTGTISTEMVSLNLTGIPDLGWQVIAQKASDNGLYVWKIPKSHQSGCYKIRVTKLPDSGYMINPKRRLVSAESKIFHIIY